MENRFVTAWCKCRKEAAALRVRLRPMDAAGAMKLARRCLDGHRESDGFFALAERDRLDLSLEALAVDPRFTPLFSDAQANTALTRLLSAGYYGVQ